MKDIQASIITEGISTYFTMIIPQKECEITLDDKVYHALSHDLIFSREDMKYQATESLLVYDFQASFFDSLFDSQISDCRILYDFLHAPDASGEHLYFSNIGNDALYTLELIFNEFSRDDIYHEKIIRLLLVGLFSFLDRNHSETLLIPRSTMIQNHIFGKIMKYIGDHYRNVTLDQVAKEFNYHPDYLSYRFKKITGMSFTKKLLSIRMEESMHLLLTTEMTIQEIAEFNGYHDRSHFSRNFKEYTGMTPKQFRKSHQKNHQSQ